MQRALYLANLSLLILLPVAWFAPLLRAGLLPLFGLREISVISGVRALWGSDVALALLVSLLAIVIPYLKIVALALLHLGALPARALPLLAWLGKLGMADVFLIALYVVVFQSQGMGHIETAWGLYLFTGCILASIMISGLTKRSPER